MTEITAEAGWPGFRPCSGCLVLLGRVIHLGPVGGFCTLPGSANDDYRVVENGEGCQPQGHRCVAVGDDARVVQRADGGHCGDSESPSWSSGLLDPLVDRLTYGSGRDGAPPCGTVSEGDGALLRAVS